MSRVDKQVDFIVEELLKRLSKSTDDKKSEDTILVEASGKHVHLSQEHVEMLFGKGYELKKVRELSQPGQYLCEEKVMIIGPKGVLNKVAVLGPARKDTQVEVSLSDAVSIGIKAPVRMSGDVKGSAGAVIATANSAIKLEEGVIAAKRHIHINPEDAKRFEVEDKEVVQVKVGCEERGLIFDNVVIRVDPSFDTAMHIDYDEANACGFMKKMRAKIIKK